MELNYKELVFTCNCGIQAQGYDSLSVTSNYGLLVKWPCMCGRTCAVVVSLQSIAKAAPQIPNVELPTSASDKEFMKKAGIAL